MITITRRADNYLPGSNTARFTGAEHGADISMFWVNTAPGAGPGSHWHPYSETWVVIRGQAKITAGEQTLSAVAGDIVTVAPRTIHSFKNSGTETLEMLCIHASPEVIQEFV